MKTKILFPNHFKRIGMIILIPSAFLGILSVFEVLEFEFLDEAKMFAIYSDDFGSGPLSLDLLKTIFQMKFWESYVS